MRLLPYYHEAKERLPRRRLPDGSMDLTAEPTCEDCRMHMGPDIRTSMGCAYEPPGVVTQAPLASMPWRPRREDTGVPICGFYLARLPEVDEALHVYPQWKQGTLTAYLDGEEPTRPLLDALAALLGGINEHDAAKAARKGGE